jgi:hypothetical protein
MNEVAPFWTRVAEPTRRSVPDQVRDALRAVAAQLAALHDEAQVEDALLTIAGDASEETLVKLRGLLR